MIICEGPVDPGDLFQEVFHLDDHLLVMMVIIHCIGDNDHLLMMMVIIHWWWWRVKQMDEPTIFLLTITMETGGEIYALHSFTIVYGNHFTVQDCIWPTMVYWTRFEKEKYRSFIPQTMGWCNMYLGQPVLAMLWESLATRNRLVWFWFSLAFFIWQLYCQKLPTQDMLYFYNAVRHRLTTNHILELETLATTWD